MFDLERFIDSCRQSAASADSRELIRELLTRELADASGVLSAVGEPTRAGIQRLHTADDLTILNVVWGPGMTLWPHNHEMWAVIGIYTGREDNIFWRRVPDAGDGKIRAAGARALSTGDVEALGPDVIHSVTNPIPRLTGAIHIYGGQFFTTPRSEWDPESLLEAPLDVDKALRLFEESNQRLPKG